MNLGTSELVHKVFLFHAVHRLRRSAAYFSVAMLIAAIGAAQAQDIRIPFFKKGAIRALIFSGRNNHDWRSTSPRLKQILLDTGRFDVRVVEEPAGVTAQTLAAYDVLVLDYCGPRWGKETEKAVETFVSSGKGLVVFHAATYPFGDQELLGDNHVPMKLFEPIWPEYRKMVGAFWDKLHEPRTGHGARHTFKVKFTDREHPIAKGMDESFLATDELYHSFRFEPRVKVQVIASAFDDPKIGGTGKEEPILWTVQYGKGRVFHTAIGHDSTAMVEPGFVASFARGSEWAATGSVASMSAPQKTKAIRTLVVTGGHAYDTSFYTVFEGYDDLIWDHAVSNVTAFNRDIRGKYDVLVLYDSSQELTDAIKKNLRDFLEAGKGLVVLHHAIVDYESWPWWYEEVVGGKYLLKPEMGMPASTYKHDEELRASVVEKHPVVAGLGAMHLMDETYKGMWISKKVKVLMTTDNPTSDGPLVWISPYQQSRVVYIQLGHDSKAHRYPAYQQLVRNGIQWAAGPSAK